MHHSLFYETFNTLPPKFRFLDTVILIENARRIRIFVINFAFVSVFYTFIPSSLKAYSNPTIKVLLFRSSGGVSLSSSSVLIADKKGGILKNKKSLFIKSSGPNRLLVNGKTTINNSLFLKSKSIISVRKPKSGFGRRYQGTIEVRPEKSGIYVINHIPMEAYLGGVLNAEISTKWPVEVVKAQSVISRTFALFKMEERENRIWHVTAGLSDQVYLGFDVMDKKGLLVLQQTEGIVVTYHGKLAQTFYHSNCGGITEDAGSLWNSSYPYLNVKNVPYGKSDPRFNWQASLSDKELTKIFRKLGFGGEKITQLTIAEFSPSGRVSKLFLNGSPRVSFLAKDFRRVAGYKKIQSLLFKVSGISGGVLFKGTGNGHGVGLSQWSAKEMAEKGYPYHEILVFFYRGTKLARYWR